MQQLLLLLLTLLLLSVQFWKDLTVSVNLLVPPGSAWVLLSFEALLSEGCTSTAPSPLRSQTRSPEGTQKNHVPPEPSGPAVPGLQPLSSSGSCCSSGRRFWFLDRPIRTTGPCWNPLKTWSRTGMLSPEQPSDLPCFGSDTRRWSEPGRTRTRTTTTTTTTTTTRTTTRTRGICCCFTVKESSRRCNKPRLSNFTN